MSIKQYCKTILKKKEEHFPETYEQKSFQVHSIFGQVIKRQIQGCSYNLNDFIANDNS